MRYFIVSIAMFVLMAYSCARKSDGSVSSSGSSSSGVELGTGTISTNDGCTFPAVLPCVM